MAALAADTEAAAGGGREVEKGFAALLRGDGGGLSGCSRLLGQRRRGGLLAKSCGGRPRNRGGRARRQPSPSGTAARDGTGAPRPSTAAAWKPSALH